MLRPDAFRPTCVRPGLVAIVGVALSWPLLTQAIPEGPDYPSAAWTQREAQNYARVLQAPLEEVGNPAFVTRWQQQSLSNQTDLLARDIADPSWLLATSPGLSQLEAALGDPTALSASIQQIVNGIAANPQAALTPSVPLNTPLTPLCASDSMQCSGDPFRYPQANGPDGGGFYNNEAVVTPVMFYDSGCARLSGRVWQPKSAAAGAKLPGVVIQNGSIQAPETLYWWAAQLLVRQGYVVLSFDPRGQGRSDQQTPDGQQGSNLNSSVFWTGLVDAIDFFRSSPAVPYPHNATCVGHYPTKVAGYNPAHALIDADRLGIAGHSLGAIGVSVVQGYGAPGADPWPGKLDKSNPVKVAVAWDALTAPGGGPGGIATNVPGLALILKQTSSITLPKFAPRVPSMGQSSEYGLTPTPFLQPPDPDFLKGAFTVWQKAGVPVYQIIIQGSTHFEFSLLPTFPATSWCADTGSGACGEGWGNSMSQHYTLAWLDRWLKHPGEPGYADADARLLDDAGPQGNAKMSFYYRSARSFPDRSGAPHSCGDVRAGCKDVAGTASTGMADPASGGGAIAPALLLGLMTLRLLRTCGMFCHITQNWRGRPI